MLAAINRVRSVLHLPPLSALPPGEPFRQIELSLGIPCRVGPSRVEFGDDLPDEVIAAIGRAWGTTAGHIDYDPGHSTRFAFVFLPYGLRG